MLIQQGDVLIKSVDQLPANLKPRKNRILVKGEATGHHHAVVTDNLLEALSDILYEDNKGNIYLKNSTDVYINHQEHKQVKVPPGTWRIDTVREYDHFLEESQHVAD